MDTTGPKPFVFVLMPFHKDFRDVYELGIKQTCNDIGTYCARVDDEIFHENIIQRIYNHIVKADIIVAEMTGRNVNVFYEVGYAHALNKQVILLTQNANDIPFDLRPYSHIVYEDITTLKQKLEAHVRWCIEHPKRVVSDLSNQIKVYLNESQIFEGAPHTLMAYGNDLGQVEQEANIVLSFSINNLTEKTLAPEAYCVTLLTESSEDKVKIGTYSNTSSKLFVTVDRLPRGQRQYVFKNRQALFPGGWVQYNVPQSHKFFAATKESPVVKSSLKLFTEFGNKEYEFFTKFAYSHSKKKKRRLTDRDV